VRQGPADGTLIWLSPFGTMVTGPIVDKAIVRFDPIHDFVSVTQVCTYDIALAVGPAAPAKTLAEYVAMVKADPNKGFFATPAANNLPHFFTGMFGKAASINMTNVPFKSGGEAITATIGGQTAALASGFGDLIQMHRAGKVRILATSGSKRSAFAPDIPTFKDAGYAIEGQGWFGIFLHKATPRDVVLRVNKAVSEALKTKELVEFMRDGGLNPASTTTPEEFTDVLKRDIKFWGAAIQASGIKFE
jgi:tripartite-type tricarboxylate transporter receptor subunit TctC